MSLFNRFDFVTTWLLFGTMLLSCAAPGNRAAATGFGTYHHRHLGFACPLRRRRAKAYAPGLTAATGFDSKFQVVTAPSHSVCTKATQDCYISGCCSTEGYMCIKTRPASFRPRN